MRVEDATSVRCSLHGVELNPAFQETVALLRGVAALYGEGLEVRVERGTISAGAESGVGGSHASGDTARLHQPVWATITYSPAAVFSDPPEGETVLEGKAAIAEWVKTLLETRLAVQRDGGGHVNSAYVAPINSEVSISGVDEKAGDDDQPIRIFVSGDRSQVGKSTVCLGLVGSLLRHGFAPSEIGYIKPATQCEAPQLITKFCRHHGITCCDIGPIVFYSGFTREYLKGNTEPADVLLAKAKAKVDEVGRGKKVVVVDGVGYPAVGSICGVSNAAVARAVQAPVVLVGKRGVGDAVDSFNLNACFFESHGVKVIGALFNRLPADGYYSLENCKASVEEYFHQFQPDKAVYGFIPEIVYKEVEDDKADDSAPCTEPSETVPRMTGQETLHATQVIDTFYQSVNLEKLLQNAVQEQHSSLTSSTIALSSAKRARLAPSSGVNGSDGVHSSRTKKSRVEIQAEAKASGAAGG